MRAGPPGFPAAPAWQARRRTSRPPVPTYPPWPPARRPATARRERPRHRPGPAGTRAIPRFPGPGTQRPGAGRPASRRVRSRGAAQWRSPPADRGPGEPALTEVLVVRADQPVVRVLLDHEGPRARELIDVVAAVE